MKLNYTVLAHTLHSRLQLIRNKLDFEPGMEPSQMVIRNLKFFEKAGESVQKYHNFRSNRSDFIDAAELFLSTVDPANPGSETGQYMVEAFHTGDNNWYPISEETLSNGMSGEIKPLTLEAAKKLHAWLVKNGGQAYARISNYKKL
ncbi:hypothetical protein GCM10010967_12170 [Dyadobacter beijingensis]|uniref:Uncharacterized protein n=1 Tax=Dyadobacter beijingensis TaxID=365489 RepID=A0ABQ2HII4_9BACT|nr:hypothetical protein [Dyadobacter beijingensis]GGM82007.1 hypothetical protein GCM10010967_12170 [Dyadobacter beijingensis]